MDDDFQIRPASPADAPTLAALEVRCFGDPWSEAAFRELFAQPLAVVRVCQRRGQTIGYAVASVVAGTSEILNLAVAPEWRRHGVGRALLEDLLRQIASRDGREAFLEVRESNQDAQALYARHGFRVVGQRRDYYRNPRETALVLRLELGDGQTVRGER